MIYTSYFAAMRKFPKNVIPVSIAAFSPKWYQGLELKELAPPVWLLNKYKSGETDNFGYVTDYSGNILSKYNPRTVILKLEIMMVGGSPDANDYVNAEPFVPIWKNPNYHIALCCYEKPGDFCHRHIVRDWFKDSGFKCEELKL